MTLCKNNTDKKTFEINPENVTFVQYFGTIKTQANEMPRPPKTLLTEREKAAIFYLAAGMVRTWKEAYIIGHDKPAETISAQAGIDTSAARWKNRPVVIEQFRIFQNYFIERDELNRTQGNSDGNGEEGDNIRPDGLTFRGFVDYQDPTNQSRKLNEIINGASDPGEALDALKVIIQTQKADRDGAKDNRTVRAYVPITCPECPLYAKAREKGKNP